MPRTPTDRAPQRAAREQPLARKIHALRPLSSDARAQQVTDVVDAFRRLRGSVVRFIRMFSAAHAEGRPDDALSAMGFRELLSTLEDAARAARFTRLPELERVIGHARRLGTHARRRVSDSFSNDPAAMRDAVAALERVDAVRRAVRRVRDGTSRAAIAPVSPEAPAPAPAPAALPLTDDSTALC